MSQSNKSVGQYLLYALMVIAILLTIAATVGVYRKVVDNSNTIILITAISAIGSCASAVASLYVANRTQKLSEIQRATEREEATARIRQNRQRIAAVYAAEIRAWLRRRDLNKFLADLRGLRSGLEILGTIEVSLLARRSNREISGSAISAEHDMQDTIVSQARRSAEMLALSSFANFKSIPSIWTTLFRREDAEVLGEGTMSFFLSMKSVWVNLTLASAQLPSSEEVVEFVNGQQPEYAEKYLKKLIDQVFVLRDLFTLFSDTAAKCMECLQRKGQEDPLAGLSVPEQLQNGSRDAAFDWSDISKEIRLDESLKKWRELKKNDQDFFAEVEEAQQGLEKHQQMLKEIADQERRSLNDRPNNSPGVPDQPKP